MNQPIRADCGAEIAGLAHLWQPIRTNSRVADSQADSGLWCPQTASSTGPMSKPDVICIIPARMAASRLPGKPLADIAGRPMIVNVMERAAAAAIGPVVVATDSEAIFAAVSAAGGQAVMTRADHASG